jgi:hypothetical protein
MRDETRAYGDMGALVGLVMSRIPPGVVSVHRISNQGKARFSC